MIPHACHYDQRPHQQLPPTSTTTNYHQHQQYGYYRKCITAARVPTSCAKATKHTCMKRVGSSPTHAAANLGLQGTAVRGTNTSRACGRPPLLLRPRQPQPRLQRVPRPPLSVRVRRRASRTSRAELPLQTAHYEINGSHVTIFLGNILTSQSMRRTTRVGRQPGLASNVP